MIRFRPATERGQTRTAWLDSRHSFSFGGYYDPEQMGCGALRVLNEDWVAPGQGFAEHGHANMEILTWVIDGVLRHRDSTGIQDEIRPGMLQRMSAGYGIRHSEMNASSRQPVHFLQLWIQPDRVNIAPSYAQARFDDAALAVDWVCIAAPASRVAEGSVALHATASLHATRLAAGRQRQYTLHSPRTWLQAVRGRFAVGDQQFSAGDGAALEQQDSLVVEAQEASELLLIELAEVL